MIAGNLNERSRLPFHGYHADAAYQLGLHGWGRGVGWYLMGLVDYLIEVPEPHNRILLKALQDAAAALMRYQRPDGHWAWVVPMPDQGADSSVTAFCGYALARARHAGLLAADPVSALDNARNALIRLIDRTGQVGSSSGECRGLGVYSMNFGPEPWSQAMTAAFFAVWPE
jgi:unsaturated rhamnogalacturonyl hydrolase